MNIGFIGLGKLGLDCAEVVASKGYKVYGYDVLDKKSDSIKILPSIEEVANNSDILFIAVPTKHEKEYGGEQPTSHLEPKDFDYADVISVLSTLVKAKYKGVTVLISTVLPGTINSLLKEYVEKLNFVYNPYLIAMGSVKWDMVNPEMIILGSKHGNPSDRSICTLLPFYTSIMENNPRFEIVNWTEAESIKIFYNTMISAKVSLVNMILDVSEKLGHMNVDKVTNALARSTQRITGPKYMIPGGPDAGACHPRDNIALRFLSKKLDLGYDLFDSIMTSREQQTKNIALKVKNIRGKLPVVIVGKGYKPGVPYTDGSGSLLLAHYLDELEIPYCFYDPLTNDHLPEKFKDKPACYVLMQCAEVTYCDSSLKDSIHNIKISPVKRSIVLDIWRKTPQIDGIKVIHYGVNNG